MQLSRHIASILVAFILLVSAGGNASADDFGRAVAAYEAGDYEAALSLFEPLAEQGDTSAQYVLGIIHYNGPGVLPDYELAAKWFRLAAESGFAEAQFSLGMMIFSGDISQDSNEALNWLGRAAEQGHAGAQFWLSVIYSQSDLVQSYKWMYLAAAQEYPEADSELAYLSDQMDSEQIKDAENLVREWLEAHPQ